MSQAPLLPSEHFSPSVSLHSGRPATTSLEVAKFFGKQHQHVMRSIDDLRSNTPESFSASNFGRAEYSDEQGKPRPSSSSTATASCCWSWAIPARRPWP